MISLMESIHLLGLLPPNNLERRLTDIRDRLFRRFGLVSALALPPVLPLSYHERALEQPARVDLPRSPLLSTGRWEVAEETLFLTVGPGEPFERLSSLSFAEADEPRARAGQSNESGKEPLRFLPIPLHRGFFLARRDEPKPGGRWSPSTWEAVDGKALLASLPPPPSFRWQAVELCCLRIRCEEPERWWGAVECEELWRVRLRREPVARRATDRDTQG